MIITSLDNKKIKEVVKLKQKKYRDIENKFIIETLNIIKEAYNMGYLLELYVLEGTTLNIKFDVPINYVSKNVFNKISSLENSYILGVCKKKVSVLEGKRYVLLDNVQDPGNLGTIIRSCVGFNVDTLVLGDTCVDLYNDKALRASEGNIFKLNIVRTSLKDVIKILKEKNITIYGTDVNDGENIDKIENNSSFALVMGNEGNGVSNDIKALVDKNLYIKTSKNLESLNVGVATGIILYKISGGIYE